MYMGFDALKSKLAKRPGVRNPGALTASIGNDKYGKSAMHHASGLGRKKGHSAAKAYLRGLSGR